jgi:hypothetical protein
VVSFLVAEEEFMKKVFALLVLAAALASTLAYPGEKESVAKAQDAATSWLALMDKGSYGASWEQAASIFKTSITREGWETAAKSVRSPLGGLKSRKLRSATYTKTVPGAPAGDYVIILFDTDFANKASTTETVVPMLEKDGSWKVSGYYIR